MNRNSDIIFFGTLIITTTILIFSIWFKTEILKYLEFFWIILLPIGLIKTLYPKSKFGYWLNKETFKK